MSNADVRTWHQIKFAWRGHPAGRVAERVGGRRDGAVGVVRERRDMPERVGRRGQVAVGVVGVADGDVAERVLRGQ